jgi:cystathionine beta-synthase
MKLPTIEDTVGNTPLVRLQRLGRNTSCTLLAKMESHNPAGSVKDRPARSMIRRAEERGEIKPGDTLIEPTSGNTGIALAMVAAMRGYRMVLIMPENMSIERRAVMKAYGAELILVPQDGGMESAIDLARCMEADGEGKVLDQFANPDNPRSHYEGTGPEIWRDTRGEITHFVSAMGTTGTIMGTGQYLKEKNPNIQIWAIDVYGSLLTKYFKTGEVDMNEVHPYISEGFGEDFVPENFDMTKIDHFEQVTDKDGAVMARRIAKEEGLFCGYSAGSCFQGLLQLKNKLKKDDLVVCIFHDHGTRYLGKIYNDQWMMERGFLEVKTFKDIVSSRASKQKLISVRPDQTVADAVMLMRKYEIEHIPVMIDDEILGAISENGLFQKLFTDPEIKHAPIQSVMELSYPLVDFYTPVEKISNMINKDTGAVLAKEESGMLHIVTKYDILQSLAK